MGHPATRLHAALKRAISTPARDPLNDPRIVRLTCRFVRLRDRHTRLTVQVAARMGALLDEGRSILRRGPYYRWLAQLRVRPQTANTCVHLRGLEAGAPDVYERWMPLGVAKLNLISRMTRTGWTALRERAVDDLQRMAFTDLRRQTARYRVSRRPTPTRTVGCLCRRLRSVERDLDALRFPSAARGAARTALTSSLRRLKAAVGRALARL
jgi:hypothetical protein